MAECSLLRIVLPPYETPRNTWREKIHAAASEHMAAAQVAYSAEDRLAVQVCLYMSESMLGFHDVDNRLKDVLDALQGRAGSPKRVRRLPALIPNDKQIVRAVIEKVQTPANEQSGGWCTIGVVGALSTSAK